MRDHEFENFFNKHLNHALHWTLFTLWFLCSLGNVFVTVVRGNDKGRYTEHVTSIDTPWPDCWMVEKYLIISLLGPIVLNSLLIMARDKFGRTSDGLNRKDRRQLKRAESKSELASRISALERDTFDRI